MEKLKNIYKHKNSDTAIYLGSGSSINNITPAQWKKIATFDTWTVNNWVYHPFVPKFYHLEVKKINRDIITKRIASRKDYGNVIWILNRDRKYLFDVIGNQKHIFTYKMEKINAVKKNIIPKYTPNNNHNVLTCNLNTTFTMMLELILRFKYKRVIFFGVDLQDSRYFWTGRKDFGKTHCQWNKDHEDRKPDQPHNTAHVKNFVVWFSRKKMRKIGGEFFVGHKDTSLFPELRYISI